MAMNAGAREVLDFWFQELKPADHFRKSSELDARIQHRFQARLEEALRGELYPWRENSGGRLAEILVLDQFSRNVHRDDPRAFSGDGMALILAQEMVRLRWDQDLPIERRAFVYMPYMHSESSVIHLEAVRLFSQKGLEFNLDFEHRHKAIIDRFGRYPHRNQTLGRVSTPDELEFLKEAGSSF